MYRVNDQILAYNQESLDTLAKAFYIDLKLLCNDNKAMMEKIRVDVLNNIKSFNIYKYNSGPISFEKDCLGYCTRDEDDKIILNVYAKNDEKEDEIYVVYRMMHELFHCIQAYFGDILYDNNIIDNNILTKPHFGGIYQEDLNNSDNNNFYGVLFLETMVDMLCQLALTYNSKEESDYNKILFTNIRYLFNSGYSKYIPLGRILMLACQNKPIDYNDSLEKGLIHSIIDKDNNINNEYMYGFIVDPLHFERYFDKYTSPGNFKFLCTKLDNMLEKNVISKNLIKYYLDTVYKFLDSKNYDLLLNKKINYDEYNELFLNFYNLYDKTLEFYGLNNSNGKLDSNKVLKKSRTS